MNDENNKHYILFTNSGNNVKFKNNKKDKILKKFSNEYFKDNNSYTIDDFDNICSDAKDKINNVDRRKW